MRFVIHKRVDAATNPPLVRYWFTLVDGDGEPIAAGDLLSQKGYVLATIDQIVSARHFEVEDKTGET